jgi:hypothetical protein
VPAGAAFVAVVFMAFASITGVFHAALQPGEEIFASGEGVAAVLM